MNVLSLFDGASCSQLALSKHKVDTYYASEVDPYAIQVTQKNFPKTIQLGDITKLTKKQLKKLDIDLVVGGSPCQGFSMAGRLKGSSTSCGVDVTSLKQYKKLKKEGFQFDGQSYLFWEFVRVLEIIQPKYWLLENVKIQPKWLKMFNAALGVRPVFIDSYLFTGALRKRYYWTNVAVQPIKRKSKYVIGDYVDTKNLPLYLTDVTDRFNAKVVGTLAFDKAHSSLRSLDSVAKCLTAGGQGISNSGATNILYKGNVYIPTPLLAERLQTMPDNYTEGVSSTQRHKIIGNGMTVDVMKHLFKGMKI